MLRHCYTRLHLTYIAMYLIDDTSPPQDFQSVTESVPRDHVEQVLEEVMIRMQMSKTPRPPNGLRVSVLRICGRFGLIPTARWTQTHFSVRVMVRFAWLFNYLVDQEK